MSRFLLSCHPHTPQCTFGDEKCPDRHYAKAKHFALEDIVHILTQIGVDAKSEFKPTHTDTMDVNRMSLCRPTITGDVFTSIPIGVYDFIIIPDCSGDWFDEQERDPNFQIPERLFQFHNTMLTNILQALKPGGYLMYSKMIHVHQRDEYVEIMNNWFATTGMPFEMKHYDTDGIFWFVLHKLVICVKHIKKVKMSKSKSGSQSKSERVQHVVKKKKKNISPQSS